MKDMMLKLGFDIQLVKLIMNCILSVSYSVLLNSDATHTFKSTRGLRQGCPLSPYLFLFCTEGFFLSLNGLNKRVI